MKDGEGGGVRVGWRRRTTSLLSAASLAVAVACSGPTEAHDPAISPRATATIEPYPYTTPTPPAEATALDGTYARTIAEEDVGPPGKCRRCPPYRLEVGPNTLTLEAGVFHVSNEATGWGSVGHFTVAGDEIRIFNDPNCPTQPGVYGWTLEGGALTLEVVNDPCAFGGLRSRYLTKVPWSLTG